MGNLDKGGIYKKLEGQKSFAKRTRPKGGKKKRLPGLKKGQNEKKDQGKKAPKKKRSGGEGSRLLTAKVGRNCIRGRVRREVDTMTKGGRGKVWRNQNAKGSKGGKKFQCSGGGKK